MATSASSVGTEVADGDGDGVAVVSVSDGEGEAVDGDPLAVLLGEGEPAARRVAEGAGVGDALEPPLSAFAPRAATSTNAPPRIADR